MPAAEDMTLMNMIGCTSIICFEKGEASLPTDVLVANRVVILLASSNINEPIYTEANYLRNKAMEQ